MGFAAVPGRPDLAQAALARKANDDALHAQAKQIAIECHGDPAKLHAALANLPHDLHEAVVDEAHRIYGNRFVDEALATKAAPSNRVITPAERQATFKGQADHVQELAAKQLPGDAKVKVAAGDSETKREAALEQGLHAQLGGGDEKGFKKFVGNNQIGLHTFAQALGGGTGAEHPSSADFYRLAMVGLKAHMPDATFQLVLAEQKHGGGGPGLQPSQGPLITATGKQGLQVFKLEEGVFGQGQDLVGILQKAGLADEWYAALKTMKTDEYADFDSGTAEKSLRKAHDFSIGVNGGAVVAAILRMAPADQGKFLAAFDRAAGFGPNAMAMIGGLLVKASPPSKFVAAAPADHLANGEPPPKESAVTLSLDGATEPHRNWNFVDKNYKAVVGAQLAQHTLRGTEPRTLIGTDLENEIGLAMGEQPDHMPESDKDLEKLEKRHWNTFEGNKRVSGIAKKIREKGGDQPEVLVVPILFDSKTSSDTGLVQFPLFRVGDSLIDHTGRVYKSFNDWRKSNGLPPGRISYPKGLTLHETAPGQVDTTTEDTHAKHPSNLEKAESVLDKAALVGGIILGGAAIIGTGGTALLVAGGVTAAYGAARSAERLDDRHDHEQSVNPFTNSEARSEWLSFGANALAVASLGTTAVAGKLASEATAVTETSAAARAATASEIVTKAGKVADVGSQINSANDLRRDWSKLSAGERANIALQLGFWGIQKSAAKGAEESSIYGAKHAEDTLANAIEPAKVAHEATAGTKVETAEPASAKPHTAEPATGKAHPTESAAQTKASQPAEHEAPASEAASKGKLGKMWDRVRGKGDDGAGLGAQVQERVVKLAGHEQLTQAIEAMPPHLVETLGEIMISESFGALSPNEQAALVKNLTSDSAAGPGANADRLYSELASSKHPPEQVLRDWIHADSRATDQLVIGGPMRERQHVAISEPEHVKLAPADKNGDGVPDKPRAGHDRYEVTLPSGHVIEVVTLSPEAPPKGFRHPTPGEVQAALGAQLPGTLEGVRKIFLLAKDVTPNRDFAGLFHAQPGGGGSTAVGPGKPVSAAEQHGQRVIELRPVRLEGRTRVSAIEEWSENLTHEVGHAADHRGKSAFDSYWGTEGEGDHAGYAKAIDADHRPISDYGSTNHQEDFAESYSLYTQVLGTPREAAIRAIYPHRFAYLDQVIARVGKQPIKK